MYLPKLYEPNARERRVCYAIANILRDRVVNEGAFCTCFEMGDEDEVIRTILRRGLKNAKLRIALEGGHLISLTDWLVGRPDLAEAYYTSRPPSFPSQHTRGNRHKDAAASRRLKRMRAK